MSKERIDLIIRNIESLIRCLKEEVKTDYEIDVSKYKEICDYFNYNDNSPYKI